MSFKKIIISNINSYNFWKWIIFYKKNKNFCIHCFIYFIPINEKEVKYIKKNVLKLIKKPIDLKLLKDITIQENIIYFYNKESWVILEKTISYSQHPECQFHESFLQQDWIDDLKYYYEKNISKKSKKDLASSNICNDNDIIWIGSIVKKTIYNNIWNSLSHNPSCYKSQKIKDILYTCSWYSGNIENSIKISIMEAIERFCEFSVNNKSSIITSLKCIKWRYVDFIPTDLYNYFFNSIYRKNTNNSDLSWIKVYNLNTRKIFLSPKDYFHINNWKCINYITSIWWSAHFSYKDSILKWIFELIERDSLMKLWFYKYSPNKYNNNIIKNISNIDLTLMELNYNLFFIKVNSIFWYVTLSIWIRKGTNNNIPLFFYWSGSWLYEVESIQSSLKELYMNYQNIALFKYKNINKFEVKDVSDHYIYYLNKNNFKNIEFLINWKEENTISKNKQKKDSFNKIITKLPFQVFIHDITPKFLYKKWIYCIKCFSPDLQPMDFGYSLLKLNKNIDIKEVNINSLLEPHPFF